jgi:DNA-binding IclR family transcriptional regulator
MSRSSPGVRRVAAVINFFADHPGQTFTLTDLVRALKVSRATCHGLLAGLVEAGYLYRTSDKHYLLGPALVSIGEVAKAHFSPLQAAQPEMRALADEFDAVCSASFREHGDVVVRERAAALSHLGFSVPRGTRLPLIPQFAGLFFVWSSPAEVQAWLKELEPPATEAQRASMIEGIELLRRHGYLVGVRNERVPQDDTSVKWLMGAGQGEPPILTTSEIDPEQTYPFVSVQGPVYDGRRRVAFVIGLQGFTGHRTGAEIERIAQRLRETCDRMTSFMAHSPKGG